MKIKTSDNLEVKENLKNKKPWFNGLHEFSSIKIQPVRLGDDLKPLGIKVKEVIKSKDVMGGS